MKKTALILALVGTAFTTACSTTPSTRNVLLGGAALAAVGAGAYYATHHNKGHDDAQANQDDYQRGLNDARNHAPRDDRGNEAYVAGYNAGRTERQQNRELAQERRQQGGGFVNVSDLAGIRGSFGEQELRKRGFDNVGGGKGWQQADTMWWNARAHECVRVITADGRYSHVDVVSPSACN